MTLPLLLRLIFLSYVTAILLIASSTAGAQQAALQTAEPKRFALVIGNATYGDPAGNLPPLGSPCSEDPKSLTDSKVVADSLISKQWDVEIVCNLKTDDLRTKISNFNDRVLTERRAFGLIYFSGHGAQVAGTNYIFGVDADINEDIEVEKYKQSSYAPLFGMGAVSLDEAMVKIQPLWGKAVVVILDACRTNPIVKSLRNKGINTIRYPASTSAPLNTVFSFATKDGSPAPDGGLGQPSRYARLLAKTIGDQPVPDQEEIEQLLSVVTTKVIVDSQKDQIPGRMGELQRPPRFCIKGCPSRLDEWTSYNSQFQAALQKINYAEEFINAVSASSELKKVSFVKSAQLSETAMPFKIAQENASSSVTPVASSPIESSNGVTRRVKVDILYCVGDSRSDERKAKANSALEYLMQLRGSASPISGFEVGMVNVYPLPASVNAEIYRANDSYLLFSENSPAQVAWANQITERIPFIRAAPRAGTGSDYLTLIICDGAAKQSNTNTLYMQIADAKQLEKAKSVREELIRALPNITIPRGIEVVDGSPDQTEVRYFSQLHSIDAQAAAAAVEVLLKHPVKARFIRGYEDRLKGAPLLELWLGKREAGND